MSSDGPRESVKLVEDITKQILTLTTGVLALSSTFIKILITPISTPQCIPILFISWSLFTLSIVGGLFTLSSIVNKLKNNEYKPFALCTVIPAILQWSFFILAFVLLWIFVTVNLN